MEHYLDNSATTKVSQKAAQKALEMMTECYGNPSSLHIKGMYAEKELENARKIIAKELGANIDEILFTSGGTEANNLAIFGAAYAKRRTKTKVVVSAIEHSSIIEAAEKLKSDGFNVTFVQPDSSGVVTVENVMNEVDDNTSIVSVMSVNNETGAIMPAVDIFTAVKKKFPDVICHTDAVQAFGKIHLNVKKLGADLLTASGHKVHAPKGCGCIYIKKGVRILPRQFGGEQEKRIRPGTEAVELIAAFGVACSEFDIDNNLKKIEKLNTYAKQKLSQLDGVVINSPSDALPYVLNISAGRVRSETMLHFLEDLDVFVSSGSACAKGKPSHVLKAMGLSNERADSALRISFSKFNTEEDIDALCNGIGRGLATLAHN